MGVITYTPSSEKLIHETEVDFVSRIVQKKVRVVQYDKNLVIVKVKLFVNGEPYILPTETNVQIRWSKKDRTFTYKPVLGCDEERTSVYFSVDDRMSFFEGQVNPIIELSNVDGEGILSRGSSQSIPFVIERNPIQNGDTESLINFLYMEEILSEVELLKNQAGEFVDSANLAKDYAEFAKQDAWLYRGHAESAMNAAIEAELAAKTSAIDAASNYYKDASIPCNCIGNEKDGNRCDKFYKVPFENYILRLTRGGSLSNEIATIQMPENRRWGAGGAFALCGNKLYVGNSYVDGNKDTIAVIDTITNVVSTISMPFAGKWGCEGAFALVGNKLYVGNGDAAQKYIAVINTTTDSVTAITMPFSRDWGMNGSFVLVGTKLYVVYSGGLDTIAVIDTEEDTVSTILLPASYYWGSRGAFALVGNKLYISAADHSTNLMAVIDTTMDRAVPITMPSVGYWGSEGAFMLVKNKLYVGNASPSGGYLAVINTDTNVVTHITAIPGQQCWGDGGAFALAGDTLYVGSGDSTPQIAAINTKTGAITSITMPYSSGWGGKGAFALCGNKLYVGTGYDSDVVAVIDILTNSVDSITMPLSADWGSQNSAVFIGKMLYFCRIDSTLNKIYAIDTTTDEIVSIDTPPNQEPFTRSFAFVGRRLYISCGNSLSSEMLMIF